MPFYSVVPPEPDPQKARPSAPDIHLSLEEDESGNVERLVGALATTGGGELTSELALDLVLNNIVEQARLATGASGAAIALMRDGEMVCRATAGATAPDLGIKMDTRSGLSGACVSTGQIQLCDDTDTDPRVDAEASRQLGARSILIIPLFEDEKISGVFEIFSPRASAFSERDIHTLQALSRKIQQDRDAAVKRITQPPEPEPAEIAPPPDQRFELPEEKELPPLPKRFANEDPGLSGYSWTHGPRRQPWYEPEQRRANAIPVRSESFQAQWIQPSLPPPRQLDFTTAVMTVLVIGAGVGLGILAGWRSGVLSERLMQGVPQQAAAAAQKPAKASKVEKPSSRVTTAKRENLGSVQDREQALRAARSSGSLVVYEDGREVYRTRPENAALKESEPGAAAIPALDESTANERLIHRVEPEYGSDSIASDQPIVLQITVDRDGSVGSATVVSGDPVRASAALAAVRKWRYELRENEARTGFQTRVTFRSAAVQR